MEKAYESLIENQFKAFENMLEGVSVYKLIFNEKGEAVDAKLEYMNHATIETMDLNQENAIGKNASELFSLDYLNLIFQAINDFLVTGKFKRFEVYYAPTDRYFIISGFNMPDDHFAVLRTDITELKHTEEALKDTRDNLEEKVEERTAELKKAYESLKESEEKYKQFFEASPNFTVHVGLNGKIIDANRAALEILSKSKEELIGTNFTEIDMLFKEDIPIHVKNFLKLLVGTHVEPYETRIKGKNGEVRWGETYPIILRKYKIPNSILVISHDITDRKRAEEQLKESEEKFRLIFDEAEDSIVLNEMKENGLPGKIIEANEATTKRLGYTKEELLNMTPQDIVAPEMRAEMRKNAEEIRNKGYAIFENIHMAKDGRRIPVEVNNHIMEFKGKKIALTVVRDITERKKAEEQLKETIGELEHSNRDLQSFAYITSHDLQEPLRTMGSYAGLLKRRYEGQLDSDADEFLDYMISGSERMKEQIKGLLDYSRMGTSGEEKEFNAEEALETALTNLKSSIEELSAEVTHEKLPNIVADESQITRVFQNLISNALKFRREGVKPKIHIKAKKEDNEYVFSVSDNGIGLEPQYSDQIFEVFKRLHAIGEYQGAGIGLAIVKRIIDNHGGRVWVESVFGRGSTFYFTIPL